VARIPYLAALSDQEAAGVALPRLFRKEKLPLTSRLAEADGDCIDGSVLTLTPEQLRLATTHCLVYTQLMFDWDPQKARANRLKHGVSFEEAATAFADPDGLDGEDLEHSLIEPRRLRLAKSALSRVLVIAYTTRRRGDEEITRIISARRAGRKERKRYEAKED